MKIPKFYTLASLIRRGRRLAPKVDTVTFDLFDTLLIRRIHDPDLVKLPVARFVAELARNRGLRWSRQQVQRLRDEIERRHRRETGRRFDDHEACYPEYMQEMLAEIFGDFADQALFEQVADYEISMENAMLVPRGLLVDWLRELKEDKKKIIIVSDIYLPANYLWRLVEHAGFAHLVDDVVSSADSFLAKASGKAFPLLQERFSLDPGRWLHVGDNPISDGLRPLEFGIRALVLHDAEEKRRKAVVRRLVNYSRGKPFWRGRALQQLMLPLEGENRDRHPLYVEGFSFFGPLIGAFVQEIARVSRERGIGKIFFLSREGWTFKKFWEEAIPLLYPDGQLPETDYLYVSRMALAGASCAHRGLSRTNADIVFLPSGNADFLDICRVFSLDPQPFTPHLARYKLTETTVLSPLHHGYLPENRIRLYEMLEDEDFQNLVKEQSRGANEALQRYLEESGFFAHRNVALVDIGWLGTIQRFLYEAISHRDDVPRCHGLLFGTTRGIPYPADARNHIEGLIYDRHRFDFAASSLLYARDLFEEACRAPHPTLNGYALKKDGGFELIFRKTDDEIGRAEKNQDEQYAPLQEGIFAAARRYGGASALLGHSLADYRPWLNHLLVGKLAFPSTAEILAVRHRNHLDDFHGAKKAARQQAAGVGELWSRDGLSLRCSPFLRLRLFMKHMKDRLNE